MCGLVGIFVKDNNKVLGKDHIDVFKQMLYADALRGFDSTGIMAIDDDGTTVLKDAKPAHQFLREIKDWKWTIQKRGFIGHNRWATRGAINEANAHPFKEGAITLVHNGSLKEHRHLKQVDVDSHAICHSFDELGDIETLEKLNGAYALVWHDKRADTLNITRNEERPLWLLETEETLLISSELGLAEWILSRNRIKTKKATMFEPGVLYRFKYNKHNKYYIDKKKYKMYKEPPKIFPAPNNVVPMQGRLPYDPHNAPNKVDIEEGDLIEVVPFAKAELQYRVYGIGKTRWLAESLDEPNVEAEIYDDDNTLDIQDQLVRVKVDSKRWSPIINKWVLVCKEPKLVTEIEEEKKTQDEEDPTAILYTRNGIGITNKVLGMVKDNNCVDCGAAFEYSTDIHLTPVIQQGKVYRYKYRCPRCTDWHMIEENFYATRNKSFQ